MDLQYYFVVMSTPNECIGLAVGQGITRPTRGGWGQCRKTWCNQAPENVARSEDLQLQGHCCLFIEAVAWHAVYPASIASYRYVNNQLPVTSKVR